MRRVVGLYLGRIFAAIEGAGGIISAMQARLRADEWKSGGRLWLVDLVVPKDNQAGDVMKACMTDLFTTALKGRKVKFHKTDPKTGKRDVLEFEGDE